jgi:hypothetical protein
MNSLPKVTRPEEFNRLLIYLADSGAGLSVSALLDLLRSSTYQGLLPDHSETISAALMAYLVHSASDRLVVAPIGEQFLSLNPDRHYELTPGQAEFLYWNVIRRPPYMEVTRSLFSMFRTRGSTNGFSLDLGVSTLSSDHNLLITILRRLGVVEILRGIVSVTKEYRAHVSAVRARRVLSADELEAILSSQKIRGCAAEKAVVELERNRLRAAGCHLEAAAVALVSDVDVAAGYDIESFDGSSLALEPDRFIEVKSTSSNDGQFFWSENERATAQDLKEKYWIYHLRAFSPGCPEKASCVLINDPVKMAKTGALTLACTEHKVTFRIDESLFSGYTEPFILE